MHTEAVILHPGKHNHKMILWVQQSEVNSQHQSFKGEKHPDIIACDAFANTPSVPK
uniref:Uncharacterized protein n=1 Tax=Arundo donax TaxID=35708 RepID=A0A0A9A466_ARUDO